MRTPEVEAAMQQVKSGAIVVLVAQDGTKRYTHEVLADEVERLEVELTRSHSLHEGTRVVCALQHDRAETAEARVAQLECALEAGQRNCDDAYNDLREERDDARQRAEKAELNYALWYRRCASLVWALPGSTTAGEVWKLEADYVTELAKAEARVAELEAQNAKLREALGKWHVMDLEGNYPDEGAFYEPTLHPIAKAALAGTEEAK